MTREQAATMLVRYADTMGLYLRQTVEAQTFTDESAIQGWAKDAVLLLQMAQVLSGYPDGSFQPAKNITRGRSGEAHQCASDCSEEVPAPTDPSGPTDPSDPPDPPGSSRSPGILRIHRTPPIHPSPSQSPSAGSSARFWSMARL